MTTQLQKARKLRAHYPRRLKRLEKIPLEHRGHRDNEDVVKLRILVRDFTKAVTKLSKRRRKNGV